MFFLRLQCTYLSLHLSLHSFHYTFYQFFPQLWCYLEHFDLQVVLILRFRKQTEQSVQSISRCLSALSNEQAIFGKIQGFENGIDKHMIACQNCLLKTVCAGCIESDEEKW